MTDSYFSTNPPDVLLLVLLSDLDVSSSWFQLMGGDFPQDLFVNGEEHLQTTLLDVVIPKEQHWQLQHKYYITACHSWNILHLTSGCLTDMVIEK